MEIPPFFVDIITKRTNKKGRIILLHQHTLTISLLYFVLVIAIPDTASAAIVTYTDATDFFVDVPGQSETLDFDTLTAGDLIADGGTVQGITFSYPNLAGFGVSLEVRDDFDTTSPPNYLGTDDGGLFQGGDAFSLDFAASNAIGLTFLTSDVLMFDDLQLTAGGTTVGLDPTAIQQTLPDGTNTYFLGIIDDM
ncbi:MAG: hypothetical protein MI861_01715, partial [Pirellulales bacterium]|nr:hypothetical protein [Pirellulales bacterium]